MPKAAQEPDAALAATMRRLREETGESQEALAYRAGITAGSLARIELAQSNPSWATVRAIAAALDVKLADLAVSVERNAGRSGGKRP
jgi:transcriptional regulator with XRE-family HTH domain